MINVSRLRMPLSILTECNDFIVCSQAMVSKYVDGKPTGETDGAKLELFDSKLLDRLNVKIPSAELPFTQNEVEAQEVHINLINPTFGVYPTGNGQIALSVRADGFKRLIKTKATE